MELEKLYNILFGGDEFLTISLLVGQKIPFHKLAKYVANKIQNIQQFEIIKDYTSTHDIIRRSCWHRFEKFIIKEELFERHELKCANYIGIDYPNWGFVSVGFVKFDLKKDIEPQYIELFKLFRKKSYEFILNRLVHKWLISPFY